MKRSRPPHLAAAIQLVVEDAGALLGVPADRRVAPGPAVRSGHAALVQSPGDGARPLAGSKPAKDLAHDIGLRLIDLPLARSTGSTGIKAGHKVVAEASAAAALAREHAALEAAPGLLGEALQVHLAHQPRDADVHLRDRPL